MLVASARARHICSNPLCSNRVAMDPELHRTVSSATLEPEPTGEARGSYNGEQVHSRSPPRSRSPARSRRRRRSSRPSDVRRRRRRRSPTSDVARRIAFLAAVRRYDERIARLVADGDTVRRGVRLVEGLTYAHAQLGLRMRCHPAAVVVYLEAKANLDSCVGEARVLRREARELRIPQPVVGQVGVDLRPAQEQVQDGAQPLQPGQPQQDLRLQQAEQCVQILSDVESSTP